MVLNPEHFLEFAKQLLPVSTTFSEAKFRCIIGRAYYAAHLFARETVRPYFPTLLSRRGRRRLGEEHELVPKLLTRKGHFGLATKLDKLRLKRAKADYDLKPVWDFDLKREAEKATELSGYVIQQIKSSPLLRRTS